MSFVAVAIGGGALLGLGGAIIGSNASQNAAQTQASAANNASQLQWDEFQQIQQNQEPWLQAGESALSGLQNPKFQQGFTMQDFQQDPGYQFDLQQGEQAIQRSAAASGGLQTGGTLKDLNNYAQGMASNEYQNAYNRYMDTNNTLFNRLASVAGLGQTANGQLNSAGLATASGIGSNMMGAANASAAGTIGSANAWSGALSGLGSTGNSLMQYQLMNSLLNNSGGAQSLAALGGYNGTVGSIGGSGYGLGPTGNPAGIDTGMTNPGGSI